MKHEEQQAFIEAYDENVNMYSKIEVERIVEGYFNAEDVSDNEGFEHVLDCLMIWMKATVYQMKKDPKQRRIDYGTKNNIQHSIQGNMARCRR